jgi:hypothetical protein
VPAKGGEIEGPLSPLETRPPRRTGGRCSEGSGIRPEPDGEVGPPK